MYLKRKIIKAAAALLSVAFGEILLQTLGQMTVGTIMESLGITGFALLPEFFVSFCIIPVLIMGVVLLTEWINLRKINNIDICNIKDE